MFPSTFQVMPTESAVKTWTRTQNNTRDVVYHDTSVAGSPSILENTLYVRGRETGSARKPKDHKRSFNIGRAMSVQAAVDDVRVASVNLTVNLPGGNYFDSAAIKAMLGELLCVINSLEGLESETNTAGQTNQVSDDFVLAAQYLITE